MRCVKKHADCCSETMRNIHTLNGDRIIRSGTSAERASVTFFNSTYRQVIVIWISFDGIPVPYKTMPPRTYFNVCTYFGHPWIFRDSYSKQKLTIEGQEVFFPKQPISDRLGRLVCQLETISIPVYSLKTQCIYTISKALTTKDHISQLHLPQSLKNELKQFGAQFCG